MLAGTLPFPVQPDDSNWQFGMHAASHVPCLPVAVAKGFETTGSAQHATTHAAQPLSVAGWSALIVKAEVDPAL